MSNLQEAVDTKSRLLALPMELQKSIIDVLDIPSKLALRITNRHFSLLIKPATHKDLVAAEKSVWAIRRGLYACMDCTQLRPSRKFADAMKKGPKGLNGKEPHKRFCIDCGLHPKLYTTRYSLGAEIKVDGKRYVLCKDCRDYAAKVGSVGSGLCRGCHSRSSDEYGLESSFVIPRGGSSARRRRRREREDEYDFAPWEDIGISAEQFWECLDP